MAKERLFNLPETKGTFQIKGLVTGTDKDNFYKDKKTKTGKDFRSINFGVKFEDDKTLYVSMNGMPKDNVYYSKKGQKNEKSETVKVGWADRHTFNQEGFKLIGCNVGVKKIVDAKGNQVNDKKTLVDFDACKEVAENLKDDNSVFVRGKIDFNSFTTDKGDKKMSVKLIPNQISLCGEVKFDDEKYEETHDFMQTIVFMGIEQEKENDKATGRFIVSAKIVNYSTIENAEFIVIDSKLAQIFKKNLKPYTAIQVWGRLDTTTQTEEVEDDDEWGESNAMTKVSTPVKRELVITGAKKSSIDADTYSQKLIDEAVAKINNSKTAEEDFGESNSSSNDWGDVNLTTDDEDAPW